jgi:thiamine transporter ThiT
MRGAVVTALPAIHHSVGGSIATQGWAANAYSLAVSTAISLLGAVTAVAVAAVAVGRRQAVRTPGTDEPAVEFVS